MRESCVLIRMSWFDLTSSRLMFAVASFRLVERAISNQTHVAVQMLKKVSDVAEEVAVFSHLCCMFWFLTFLPTILFYVYNDLTFWKWATWPPPVAFGILSSQPGRHVCPFGPLGPRCRKTGEVYCCWRKNTGKEIWWCSEMVHTLEVWLNDDERTPVVASWNYCNQPLRNVITDNPITSNKSTAFCSFILDATWVKPFVMTNLGWDPLNPSVLTPEDPEMEDSLGDMAQRYKDTVRSDVFWCPGEGLLGLEIKILLSLFGGW